MLRPAVGPAKPRDGFRGLVGALSGLDEFRVEWRGRWIPMGFPSHHRENYTASMKWPDSGKVERCSEILDAGGMLALVGPRGTGKTQLAFHLAALNDEETVYMRVSDLCSAMKEWLDLPSGDRAHNLSVLRNVPLLVVDEFHERQRTEYEDLGLVSLMDKRYGERLPTVLIANLTAQEFVRDVGSSIASRIQETGAIVVCDWPSFRARAKP